MAQSTMKFCSSCVPERKTFLQMTHFHKYYSRDKYNHFKEHSVGLLEQNYLQRGKTIVVECTEEKPQNLETPSMH